VQKKGAEKKKGDPEVSLTQSTMGRGGEEFD
jgi:hypothetical protein